MILVDPEDQHLLDTGSWFLKGGYVVSSRHHPDGRVTTLRLHREIMGAASGQAVDHKNGNKLDNRRANLRFATQRQNTWNRAPKRHTRTGLKGVKVKRDRFEAVIQKTYIGTFATAHDAARAYDAAALQRYGEFARTNFPT